MDTIILIMAAVGCLALMCLLTWLIVLFVKYRRDSIELKKLKERLIKERIEANLSQRRQSNVIRLMKVG